MPKLTRRVVEDIVSSGRRLIVQGAMGIHASDGLSGKVAAQRGSRLVGVGTISAVLKTPEHLVREIRRCKREARGGFVGVNFMAAVNRLDFEASVKLALAEGVSFVVQGAGVSREIVKWCRDANTPFVGIVSSGRLAAMYERWGADLLVAEGAEAGGHIGDIDHPLPKLVAEVVAASSLPVIAAGGVDASDLPHILALGAAGAQLATRFLASSDGDVHPNFKRMHLQKGDEEVTLITSCVKGMKARAIRNAFTDKLARGERVPPRSKAWFYGETGFHGRRKACVECLGAELCLSRVSDHRESFCITDALLAAAIKGDMENGLFYTGQSVTRIRDLDIDRLPSIADLFDRFEAAVRPMASVEAAVPA
ncbi:MAG TPA: nitronate monooxygenase [Anaeromyxobacteraceae bacterium]|nr:nitronate monooxygenase [Anaeromyxobacteraceae bacterium]